MSSPHHPGPEQGNPDQPHQLACGACQALLDHVYPNRARADEAADDHVPEHHPEHETVVVLAVPVAFLEERSGETLALAIGAQRRVERRDRANAAD